VAIRFRPEQLRRIDLAEGAAYAVLYRAAAPDLGTGSTRLGDVTLIWHPGEDEAGYNCLVNFHLADNLDQIYDQGFATLKDAGSPVIGVPIDDRVISWATAEKIESLGLEYQSDEVIWGRELLPEQDFPFPDPPQGIEVRQSELQMSELQRLINLGWGLEPDNPRGVLYSHAPLLPDWKVYVAWAGVKVAGISVFCAYESVGLLMLAVVLPGYRGKGLQSFFIAERLAESFTRGCTIAISETNDDNSSPRNLQRAGFEHCVTRRIFSRAI